jgi:hypothetical protein
MKKLLVLGALCSVVTWPLACTVGDDDSGAAGRGGSAGSGGTAGSAGTSGKAGSSAGTAGDGGKSGNGAAGQAGASGAAGTGTGGSGEAGSTAAEGGAGGVAGGQESAGAAGLVGEAGDGAAGAEDRPKATSGFDASADGWTITGDAQASSVAPDYSGVGGNPDGLISAVDDVTGGTWYFTAPSKYLGDATRFYGSDLKFDLKVTEITSPFAAPDVLLVGGGITAAYDCTPDPGTDWTTFTVPLSESGWTLTDLDGPALTAEQFQAVLADLTSFRIRGEFNTGADTGSLDNVKFGTKE